MCQTTRDVISLLLVMKKRRNAMSSCKDLGNYTDRKSAKGRLTYQWEARSSKKWENYEMQEMQRRIFENNRLMYSDQALSRNTTHIVYGHVELKPRQPRERQQVMERRFLVVGLHCRPTEGGSLGETREATEGA